MILQVLFAMVAGWFDRHQQQVIAYFQGPTFSIQREVKQDKVGELSLRELDGHGCSCGLFGRHTHD